MKRTKFKFRKPSSDKSINKDTAREVVEYVNSKFPKTMKILAEN